MDRDLKVKLVAETVPALGIPLAQAALNHHFSMKQIEKEGEMQQQIAERRAQGVREVARHKGGGRMPRRRKRMESPGDIYDELESLRRETNCQFCHSAIDSLLESPPEEAEEGYYELREYVDEVERMKGQEINQQEAEEIVGDIVETWEVIPQHMAR